MDKKQEVLRVLRESGDFVSGQELSETLGVSRAYIWKIIQKLREEGYPVKAVTNKGYRLLPVEADLFNEEQIAGKLHTKWAGHPLIFLEKTDSTNNEIYRLSDQGYPEGTLAVSSEQTGGKGRRGRTWISPAGVNVYMSILLRPTLSPSQAPTATLVMALAVCEAVEELLIKDSGHSHPVFAEESKANSPISDSGETSGVLISKPNSEEKSDVFLSKAVVSKNSGTAEEADKKNSGETGSDKTNFGNADSDKTGSGNADSGDAAPEVLVAIKWPNDIVVSVSGGPWKKVCGILTEMRMEEADIRDVVIGTGININQTEFPEELQDTASSLKLATGRNWNRSELTALTWDYFEKDYEQFTSFGDLRKIRKAYEKRLVNTGRMVRILDPKEPFTARAGGITDSGELIVYPEDGSGPRTIGTGEISVRGVEGYV